MIRSAASKVRRLGRATVFLVGLAVILALVFGVATTAMSTTGKPFILGQLNEATQTSKLMKNGAGVALSLFVREGQPPLRVNSDVRVANLNADEVDGLSSGELKGQQGPPGEPRYTRTVVVSPEDGATPTQNGTALLAALDGITGATATDSRLLYIEPGTYDLGTGTLQMKPFVDIEGSGEMATTITSAIAGGRDTGTVKGANNAEMRFLSVENTAAAGADFSSGINNSSASPQLTSMSVTASGATVHVRGVYNENSSPVMTDVRVTASGGDLSRGVWNFGASSTTIRDSIIEGETQGILTSNASGSPTIRVDDSRIGGSVNTIWNVSGYTVQVGASQLAGGSVLGTGTTTITCAGVYDENYAFSSSTCP